MKSEMLRSGFLAGLPGVLGAAAPQFSIVRGGVYAAGGTIFTAGSQSISFINDDEVPLTKGMLVYLSKDTEGAVKRCPKDYVPIGVVTSESIPVGSRGQVATKPGTVEEISCTEDEVQLGDALVPSDTAGVAKSGSGYTGGLALEPKEAGAVGNVRSLLAVLSNLPTQNGWYLLSGISDDQVLSAWQFNDRVSEEEARISINKNGDKFILTNKNTSSLPTWRADIGFTIPAVTTAGLDCADLRARASEVACAAFQFSGGSLSTSNSKGQGGIFLSGTRCIMLNNAHGNTYYGYYAGIAKTTATNYAMIYTARENRVESGVYAANFATPGSMFINGLNVSLGTYTDTRDGYFTSLGIICQLPEMGQLAFNVQKVVFYTTTLTDGQHLELYNNMARH